MASKHKSNISWSSILLTLLLIAAVASVVWVLSDIAKTIPPTSNTKEQIAKPTIISIDKLANTLISQFTAKNISQKDQKNTLQAVKNTLQHLQDTNNDQTLEKLQKLDLSGAINTLNTMVEVEEKPRNAAKIWVDIGNLQQLQSSQLALYAYKKASKLDDNNINAWNRLGHYYRQQQKFSLAENAYTHVLQSANKTTKALAYTNFGLLYQAQSQLDEAETAYLKALNINLIEKNTASLASNSENLAIIYKQKNNFEASEKYYLNALSHYETLQQSKQIANIQTSLASLYHKNNKLDDAKHYYQTALNIYLKEKNQRKIADIYSNLGIIHQQQNQASEAKAFFEKSLEINQALDSQQGIAEQYGNLGILYRSQKNLLKSESSHLKSLQIYQALSHKEGISQQQTNLGFLYQAWDQTDKACEYWKKSTETLSQTKNTNRIERIKTLLEKYCLGTTTKDIDTNSPN